MSSAGDGERWVSSPRLERHSSKKFSLQCVKVPSMLGKGMSKWLHRGVCAQFFQRPQNGSSCPPFPQMLPRTPRKPFGVGPVAARGPDYYVIIHFHHSPEAQEGHIGNSECGDERSGDSAGRDLILVALVFHCQESCVQLPHTFQIFFFPKKKRKFVFQVLPNVTSMLTVPGSVNSVARYNQGPASDNWADPQSLIPGCSVFVGWTSGGCIFVFMYLHA